MTLIHESNIGTATSVLLLRKSPANLKTMSNSWLIENGRIIDPLRKIDRTGSVYVENGRISDRTAPFGKPAQIINANGLWVLPGFTDLHVHFREPGNEEAETILSGSTAASHGGFTSVVVMPNTTPPIDTPERIKWVLERSSAAGLVRVLPAGCITRARAGKELADLEGMASAGAVAFTDDGSTVANDDLMRKAMDIAHRLHRPVMDHALDPAIAGSGVMHSGKYSKSLNVPGIPSEAEVKIVKRDINLARETGCAVHIQHVSSGESVELIRCARKEGLPVSAEATPHHMALTDADVRIDRPDFKMNPPLRTNDDRLAIIAGIADNTIEALATDHAPHRKSDKDKGFLLAPFGIVGLETAVGVSCTVLVKGAVLSPMEWAAKWTIGPARILGLPLPSLAPGSIADIVLIDPQAEWAVRASGFASKSHNTPFEGTRQTGMVAATFLEGTMTWTRD